MQEWREGRKEGMSINVNTQRIKNPKMNSIKESKTGCFIHSEDTVAKIYVAHNVISKYMRLIFALNIRRDQKVCNYSGRLNHTMVWVDHVDCKIMI